MPLPRKLAAPVFSSALPSAKLAAIVRPGGKVLLVTLEHDAGSGPPFDVDRALVFRLFAGAFTIEELGSEDIFAESKNIAAKGATRVHERAYLLERASR